MKILLSRGSSGYYVKELQKKLNKILGTSVVVDGIFGDATDQLVRKFQTIFKLKIDGIIGNYTWTTINLESNKYTTNLMTFGKRRFVVFVDAGHGGVTIDGIYTTKGKKAFHPDIKLHQKGNYYEGYENRIAAELFIEKCTDAGIQTIRIYHPYKDTSLFDRCEIVKDWLYRGYYGYLHSFHSNAISSRNSPAKMLATRGFSVYTTKGNTLSDDIAATHMDNVRETVGDWRYRYGRDGNKDSEANFYILRNTELEHFAHFGAILEEFGFHTSAIDCLFITEHREQRAEAAVKTALWTKEYLDNI